jgi:hypothetical protein
MLLSNEKKSTTGILPFAIEIQNPNEILLISNEMKNPNEKLTFSKRNEKANKGGGNDVSPCFATVSY